MHAIAWNQLVPLIELHEGLWITEWNHITSWVKSLKKVQKSRKIWSAALQKRNNIISKENVY